MHHTYRLGTVYIVMGPNWSKKHCTSVSDSIFKIFDRSAEILNNSYRKIVCYICSVYFSKMVQEKWKHFHFKYIFILEILIECKGESFTKLCIFFQFEIEQTWIYYVINCMVFNETEFGTFCVETKENRLHLFWNCYLVQNFLGEKNNFYMTCGTCITLPLMQGR